MLSFDKVVIKTNSLGEESIVPDIHNKKIIFSSLLAMELLKKII